MIRTTGLMVIFTFLLTNECPAAERAVIAKVSTTMLSKRDISDTINGLGTVSTGIGEEVSIAVPRAGQLTSLNILIGQRVRKGDTLALFNTGIAESLTYKQASLDVAYAKDELARNQNLFSQNQITNTQLAQAQKTLETAEANLSAQVRLNNETPVETIKAPFDALVTNISAAKGDYIPAGALILKITRPSKESIQIGIEPGESSRVRSGMQVKITSLADRAKTVTTAINETYGIINPQTRLVDAQVNLEGSNSKFYLGEKVLAEIRLQSHSLPVVPRSAVLNDSSGSYIYQVEQKHAKKVYVKTGQDDGQYIAILTPLNNALPVVTLGNYELADGMQVQEIQR